VLTFPVKFNTGIYPGDYKTIILFSLTVLTVFILLLAVVLKIK